MKGKKNQQKDRIVLLSKVVCHFLWDVGCLAMYKSRGVPENEGEGKFNTLLSAGLHVQSSLMPWGVACELIAPMRMCISILSDICIPEYITKYIHAKYYYRTIYVFSIKYRWCMCNLNDQICKLLESLMYKFKIGWTHLVLSLVLGLFMALTNVTAAQAIRWISWQITILQILQGENLLIITVFFLL